MASHGPSLVPLDLPPPPSPPPPVQRHRRLHDTLVDWWFAAQVELHGQYSITRLENLHAYEQRTPMWRVLLVCTATPALAVLLITLTDWIPLQHPHHGLSHSHLLWLRAFLSLCCIAGPTLLQLRIIVPKLHLSLLEALVLTVLSACAAAVTQLSLAYTIGYPVPFGLVLGTPACFAVLVIGIVAPRRARLRAKPQLRQQLKDYVLVWVCQVGFTVMYPVYNYAFSQLSGHAQTAFAMLLPVLKLVNKNWMSYSLRETDDMRPELVVFNVEVFHALYTSVCMQSSTSMNTTFALMGVDFLQAWLSIQDVNTELHEIQELLAKSATETTTSGSSRPQRNMLQVAMATLADDPQLRHDKSLRVECFASSAGRRRSSTRSSNRTASNRTTTVLAIKQATNAVTKGPFFLVSKRASQVAAVSETTTTTTATIASGDVGPKIQNQSQSHGAPVKLTGPERLQLVQKLLQLAFLTEFVVLVEYTEVMVPLIYNACVRGMIRLPNREFYALLAGKSDLELQRTVDSVALYGSLELASFVLFCVCLRWKVRFSVLTQVAFVLETQFVMVQSKIVMWVFYVLQTSLLHFGADYSFAFSWLRSANAR